MDVQETKDVALEFPCVSCGRRGFKLKTCEACNRVKLCGHLKCRKHHDPECQGPGIIPECEIDMGRILEIEEVEVEAGGRVLDLGSSKSCVRHGHNKHGDYIDYSQFTIDHLPPEIRHPSIFQYIIAKSLKTVRITSKWTSMNRPDSDPYAHQRGTRRSRLATGFSMTYASEESFVRQICEVPDCHRKADLGQEHYVFAGEIFVYTNRHVVFDEEEMKRTSIEFFYDSYDKAGVMKEYGLKFTYTKFTSDRSFFTITVHDESFLKRLLSIAENFIIMSQSVPRHIIENMEVFVIIISHPHGMPKKISIGKITKTVEENVSPQTEENAKKFGEIYAQWAKSTYEIYLKLIAKQAEESASQEAVSSSGTEICHPGLECDKTNDPVVANSNDFNKDKKEMGTSDKIKEHKDDKDNGGKVTHINQSTGENKHTEDPNLTKDNREDAKIYKTDDLSDQQVNKGGTVMEQGKIQPVMDRGAIDQTRCLSSKSDNFQEMTEDSKDMNSKGTDVVLDSALQEDINNCAQRPDTDVNRESDNVSYDKDGRVEGEDEMVDFMSTSSFPVVTKFHNAPTCQGSSGGPVIHKGFQAGDCWLPLTGGHFGYDLNLHYSFYRYNKASL